MSDPVNQSPKKAPKLTKATVADIVLCLIIPGWGILVGLIALAKREWKRAGTMILISVILLAVFWIWMASRAHH